jgi:hypothetical protein
MVQVAMSYFRLLQALWIVPLIFHPSQLFWVSAQVCNTDADGGVCEAELDKKHNDVESVLQSLFNWFRAEGGFIHPSLRVGYKLIPDDDGQEEDDRDDYPSYSFGLFVKQNETIAEGEKILYFPPHTMINVPRRGDFPSEDVCLLAQKLAQELFLHKTGESTFGPYVDFIERFALDEGNVPGTWSEAGRELLHEIDEDGDFFSFAEYHRCFEFNIFGEEDDDEHEENQDLQNIDHLNAVIEASLSRGRDDNLVPIYDMINHSNDPKKINIAKTAEIDTGKGFGVKATRAMKSEEEIVYSYGFGNPTYDYDLGFTYYGIGTQELFRDYGFVEPYPQRWHFGAHGVDFAIREGQDKQLELVWLTGRTPDDDAVYFFKQEFRQFSIFLDNISSWQTFDVPAKELKLIREFLSAYLMAIKMAVEYTAVNRETNESEYSVQEETVIINDLDSRLFQQYQCNTLIQRVFDGDFETIETLRSAYQRITYYKDPQNDDVCLYLDDVYQQCVVSLLQ